MQQHILRVVIEKALGSKKFLIAVNIENKAYLDDPEGDTILRDLIVKGGYSNIESVRSAKTLKIVVKSSSEKEALKTVENLCTDLRIYNPVLSDCTIVSAGMTT
jgi:phosphoribosylformylglycinamidine (FGAM) synthase PurS component